MAKKATIKAGLFSKTTTPTPAATKQAATDAAATEKDELDKVAPMSVSLTKGEYAEMETWAAESNATRMAVMNAAIRYTMALYKAGKVKLKTGTKAGRVTVTFE